MEIKIKAVGKNVILDNELIIKVKEGLDMSTYETGYINGNYSAESVTGDPASEIHYFFNENMTETDNTPFDSAIDPMIKNIQFPNQVTLINDNIITLGEDSVLTEVKCGKKVTSVRSIFFIPESGVIPWSQTINVLLPGAAADIELPTYTEKVKFWVPASVLEALQTTYPENTFANISEYKEQA